jgi:hypothetical protein
MAGRSRLRPSLRDELVFRFELALWICSPIIFYACAILISAEALPLFSSNILLLAYRLSRVTDNDY